MRMQLAIFKFIQSGNLKRERKRRDLVHFFRCERNSILYLPIVEVAKAHSEIAKFAIKLIIFAKKMPIFAMEMLKLQRIC